MASYSKLGLSQVFLKPTTEFTHVSLSTVDRFSSHNVMGNLPEGVSPLDYALGEMLHSLRIGMAKQLAKKVYEYGRVSHKNLGTVHGVYSVTPGAGKAEEFTLPDIVCTLIAQPANAMYLLKNKWARHGTVAPLSLLCTKVFIQPRAHTADMRLVLPYWMLITGDRLGRLYLLPSVGTWAASVYWQLVADRGLDPHLLFASTREWSNAKYTSLVSIAWLVNRLKTCGYTCSEMLLPVNIRLERLD